MSRTRMERVYVQYFCENCGKVEFEGRVFGVERIRHLQAESGTRTMFCDHCRPKTPKVPEIKLNSWFFEPYQDSAE